MRYKTLFLGLLLGLSCLGGCSGVDQREARNQALADVSACQGTYPQNKGTLAPLMRCEGAADMAYARQVAPEDVSWFSRYAQDVERSAAAVDQGQLRMSAWQDGITDERHAESPKDRRMFALYAMLPAAPSAT